MYKHRELSYLTQYIKKERRCSEIFRISELVMNN